MPNLVIKVWAIAENVSVRIDQAWQHRGVGEIDNFSICGNLYVPCWANLNNAVSLDQDDLIGRKLVTSVK
jgi:hypothetical protein